MFWFGGGFGGGEFGSRVVSRARQDLGRTEQGGNNHGAVVQELMRGTGYGQGAAWCAGAATNWTNDAAQSSLGRNLVRTTAAVSEMMGDYRRAGAFSRFNGDLSNVRVGDAVFFRRQGGGHTGIVTSNNGSSIGIIEGNVSLGGGNVDGRSGAVDGVYEATWGVAELQQRSIVGFGHNEARYQKASGRQPERSVASRNDHQGERAAGAAAHGAQQAAAPSFFTALFGGANHQAEQPRQAEQNPRHGRRAERHAERGAGPAHGAQPAAPSPFAFFFGGGNHPSEQQHAADQPRQGRRKHAAGGAKGSDAQHVDHASLGSFPSPFGAFFNKPPQGHSKG